MSSVFLTTQHLFLRDPHGGVEDVAAMQAAGFGAIFCNIGDHQPDSWQLIRDRARAAGVVCGPWLRTADAANKFDYDRFHTLLRVADEWGTPLIVNSETELLASGGEITSYIEAQLGDRDAAISVETWPFDNVDWWHLGDRPVLPQLFKSIVSYEEQPTRDIWHAYGIRCVVLTFGSYGGSVPADYDRLAPFGVYTADDCGQRYSDWSPLGSCQPCTNGPTPPDEGGDMDLIGTQHGVDAAIDRLIKLDPAGSKPNRNENDLATWGAYDKLRRTLTILVSDHDEQAGKAAT